MHKHINAYTIYVNCSLCPLGVVAVAARVQLQVCVTDTHTHTVRKYCCAEVVQVKKTHTHTDTHRVTGRL